MLLAFVIVSCKLTTWFDEGNSLRQDNIAYAQRGIIETSTQAIEGLKKILELKTECEEKRIYSLGKKTATAKLLLDALYKKPVMYAEEVVEATGLSKVSAYKMIDDFMRLGVLTEDTGFKRNRLFVFREYFQIFE
jgi:Fic family protein